MANPDKCYVIKKNRTSENKDVKRIPIEEVKTALRELVAEQKGSNNQDDRAAFMQVGRFDQIRFIHKVQCHEDQIQEELSSSEAFSDKSGDTESEAEFITVTGSANNNQESSEESYIERKHIGKGQVKAKQNDEMTIDSGEDEYEAEKRKGATVKKYKNKRKRKLKRK